MAHPLASLLFYARFFHSFSRLGVWRCQRGAPAPDDAFHGQHWLVSGATDGIGRAIAEGAAQRGALVSALGRNPEKLEALRRALPPGRLQPIRCDLSMRADTLRAIAAIDRPIDVLVNNVGVMLHDYGQTAEGAERSVATNLLVPFAMTEALRENGQLTAEALILNMSSGGMYGARLDLDQLEVSSAAQHDGFMAYAQHKRAQAVLCEYWNAQSASRVAHVMHPGWVDTPGVQSALPAFRRTLGKLLRSAGEGADVALWLAHQRPDAATKIWHDRAAHDLHAFSLSKGGADSTQLVTWLRERLAKLATG